MDGNYGKVSAILLGLYLAFLLLVGGLFLRRRGTNAAEYLVMGRRLSLPAFLVSMVSTWYGGILGVGEYSFKYGLSNWIVFGLPYYLAAMIFALFLASRAQRTRHMTVPDQLHAAYGKTASLLGAIFIFINAVPSAYVLQLGVLAQLAFGLPLSVAIIGGAIFSMFYVYSGGLRGDVITDAAQFFLMFAGFGLILFVLVGNYGGLDFLQVHLPPEHFTWRGGRSASYVIVWYFIAMAALVEPALYQRCFAAQNPAVAKRGLLLSIPFWALFDFMTTTTGMYARALLPQLGDPVASYPMLGATVLPPLLQGVFLVALFATVMSTVDSYTLVAGITLGKDILLKLKPANRGDQTATDYRINLTTLYSRLGLVVAGFLAVVIALRFRSVVDIWYVFGTINTCALLVPLAGSFWPHLRMSSPGAVVAILVPAAVAVVWMTVGDTKPNHYWLGLDPIYPGLATSAVIYAVDRILRNAKQR